MYLSISRETAGVCLYDSYIRHEAVTKLTEQGSNWHIKLGRKIEPGVESSNRSDKDVQIKEIKESWLKSKKLL